MAKRFKGEVKLCEQVDAATLRVIGMAENRQQALALARKIALDVKPEHPFVVIRTLTPEFTVQTETVTKARIDLGNGAGQQRTRHEDSPAAAEWRGMPCSRCGV